MGGCFSAKPRPTVPIISIDSVDIDTFSTRVVEEYPFYETRLKEIDWQSILKGGKKFEDPYFPANVSSILDEMMAQDLEHKKWKTLVWKRPSEVLGPDYKLFEKIDPADIRQGLCGNCYFLSSLSSLAEFPERIKRIFLNTDTNDVGIYAVTLFVNGIKRTVVVDDRFPYDQHKEKWAFSRTSSSGASRSEIWVLVLEKAWAKVYGSYQRIEAGTTGEALHPLTGCPTQNFVHDEYPDKEKLWKLIQFSDQQKFTMCCCIASQAEGVSGLSSTDMQSMGLINDHAYSLLGTQIIKLKNGGTERLLYVRNPWGAKEWNGKWSDKDPNWDLYKNQVSNFEVKDDGCFYISFSDYDKFFYITTICYYVEGYDETGVCDQHAELDTDENPFGLAKFEIERDTTQPVAVSINQVNSRFVDETMRGTYEYAQITVLVGKVITKTDVETGQPMKYLEYLEGKCSADGNTTFAFHEGLQAGLYLVMYQASFKPEQLKKVSIQVYCQFNNEVIAIDNQSFGLDRFTTFCSNLDSGYYLEEKDTLI